MSGGCNSSSPSSGGGSSQAMNCVGNCSAATPYEKQYATAEDAAVAAMQHENPSSIKMGREKGSWVKKNADGTFTPRPAVTGTKDGLGNMPPPESNDVVWWHTHGANDPGYDNENFSGASGDKGYSDATGKPGYVATPSGTIKKYDPADKSETTLKQKTKTK